MAKGIRLGVVLSVLLLLGVFAFRGERSRSGQAPSILSSIPVRTPTVRVDPILADGGRLDPAGLLYADAEPVFRSEQLLLEYLVDGDRRKLQSAYEGFGEVAAGGTRHQVLGRLGAAGCAEILEGPAARDELLERWDLDPDAYAWLFEDPSRTVQALAFHLWHCCVDRLRYMEQAMGDYTRDLGVPPETSEALYPRYYPIPPRCPSGVPYRLERVDGSPEVPCGEHSRFGLPVLAAPGVARESQEVENRNHVFSQVLWRASMDEEGFRRIAEALTRAAAIRPGSTVADVGCGIGYYSAVFARAAQPGGEVWGVDVNESVLRYVDFYASRHPELNLHTLHSRQDDTLLPPEHFDAVVLAHVYRALTSPQHTPEEYRAKTLPFLKSIWRGLVPGGRFVVMDGERFDTAASLTVASSQVIEEVTGAGFRHLPGEGVARIPGDTPYDYVVVFEKVAAPPGIGGPSPEGPGPER